MILTLVFVPPTKKKAELIREWLLKPGGITSVGYAVPGEFRKNEMNRLRILGKDLDEIQKFQRELNGFGVASYLFWQEEDRPDYHSKVL